MYGMSHFMLQLNYFPKRLQKTVAPTDTRWRPDQRSLENGEMKTAATYKNMLEEKQRAVRRYREKNNIEYKPAYFYEELNSLDGVMYWKYNYLYFEHDKVKKDWSRLHDIYSPDLPKEILAAEETDSKDKNVKSFISSKK